MYDRVITKLKPGEIIDPKLKGVMKNLIAARRANNDKILFEQSDVLSTLVHYLFYAVVMEWLAKSRKVASGVGKRAGQIGIDQAVEEAKVTVTFYRELANAFTKSEKTSKYVALDLQRKGREVSKRLKHLLSDIDRYGTLLEKQQEDKVAEEQKKWRRQAEMQQRKKIPPKIPQEKRPAA